MPDRDLPFFHVSPLLEHGGPGTHQQRRANTERPTRKQSRAPKERQQETAASHPSHIPSSTPASSSLAGVEGVIDEGVINDVKLEAHTIVIVGMPREGIICPVTAGAAVGVRTREDAAAT